MRQTATRILARPSAPAAMVGALLALQLLLLRALGSATTESVTFAGRELQWGCSFREWFGIPCPNCGMTRSVLLSLHGHFAEAWAMNPAGVLLVTGVALFSAAMLLLVVYEWRRAGAGAARARRMIRHGALVYAAALVVVWFGQWVLAIS